MKSKNIIFRIVTSTGYVLATIIVAFLMFMMVFLLYSHIARISNAITLADRGISTTATISEYKPYRTNRSRYDYYVVAYDNHVETIDLHNDKYPINSKLAVIYDRNNPKLIWLGNKGMSAWELYKLNNSLFLEVVVYLVFILVPMFIIRKRKQRRTEFKINKIYLH